MSSDEEDLPKISFGSFTSGNQECKREPGVIGPISVGGEQSRRPTDPRLATNKRQGYRPSPQTILMEAKIMQLQEMGNIGEALDLFAGVGDHTLPVPEIQCIMWYVISVCIHDI
jgi:hypothetical protein